MMNLEMVVENVKEMMGERYSVEARTVQKNNGLVLEGIVVREGDSAIAPTIYVTEEQLGLLMMGGKADGSKED